MTESQYLRIMEMMGMGLCESVWDEGSFVDTFRTYRAEQALACGVRPERVFDRVGIPDSEGMRFVESRGKMNFITTDNKVLCRQWFDAVGWFSEGFAPVRLNRKWNFVDTDGEYLSDVWFDRVGYFTNGTAQVMLNNKFNVIGSDGRILSDEWFNNAKRLSIYRNRLISEMDGEYLPNQSSGVVSSIPFNSNEVTTNNPNDGGVTILDKAANNRVYGHPWNRRGYRITEGDTENLDLQKGRLNNGARRQIGRCGGRMANNISKEMNGDGSTLNATEVRINRLRKERTTDPESYERNGGDETLKSLIALKRQQRSGNVKNTTAEVFGTINPKPADRATSGGQTVRYV